MDAGKAAKPVLGQEQYIDVELDRNTQLLAPQIDVGKGRKFTQGSQDKRISSADSSSNLNGDRTYGIVSYCVCLIIAVSIISSASFAFTSVPDNS